MGIGSSIPTSISIHLPSNGSPPREEIGVQRRTEYWRSADSNRRCFYRATSSPVTISAGAVTVQTLVSKGSLTLSGGTLTLNGDSQIDGHSRNRRHTGWRLACSLSRDPQPVDGRNNDGRRHHRFESNLGHYGGAQKALTGIRILNLYGITTWRGIRRPTTCDPFRRRDNQ